MSTIRPAVILCSALLSAACGTGTGASPAVVRDSAGIRIAENHPPDSAHATWWRLDPEPRFDAGALEGAEGDILFRVVGAARLSDGRIVVANSGTSEVRYYGTDGRHLLSHGREGGGPGEFRRITRLIPLPGDSVAVVDDGAQRLTVLDPRGVFAREVAPRAATRVSIVGQRDDGAWVGSTATILSGSQIPQGLARPDVAYVVVPPGGGAPLDTLGRFAGSERFVRIAESGGEITSVEIVRAPFSKTTTVITHGGELIVATQDHAEVRGYDPEGALRQIVRTGAAPRPVTPELIDAVVERRVADLPADRRRAVRDGMLATVTAEFVPPYGTIAVDDPGNLWVQDYPELEDDQRWTIYDPDGALAARIALPATFTPYQIGDDWILGRELDELEVEHVRLYGIERAPGAR